MNMKNLSSMSLILISIVITMSLLPNVYSNAYIRNVTVEVYHPSNYDLKVEGYGDVYVLFGRENIYSKPKIYEYTLSGVPSNVKKVESCLDQAFKLFRGRFPNITDLEISRSNYTVMIFVKDEFISDGFIDESANIFGGCIDKVLIYGTIGGKNVIDYAEKNLDRWIPYNESVIGYIDRKAVEVFSKYGELGTFFGLHASIRLGYERALLIVIQSDIKPKYSDIVTFISAVRDVVPTDIPIILSFHRSPNIQPLIDEQNLSDVNEAGEISDNVDTSINDEGIVSTVVRGGGHPINLVIVLLTIIIASLALVLYEAFRKS